MKNVNMARPKRVSFQYKNIYTLDLCWVQLFWSMPILLMDKNPAAVHMVAIPGITSTLSIPSGAEFCLLRVRYAGLICQSCHLSNEMWSLKQINLLTLKVADCLRDSSSTWHYIIIEGSLWKEFTNGYIYIISWVFFHWYNMKLPSQATDGNDHQQPHPT